MAKWIIQVGNDKFFVSDHKKLHFGEEAEELNQEQVLATMAKLTDSQRISSLKPDSYRFICVEKSV
jgi:hypothetical protein